MQSEKQTILGVPIDNLRMKEALERAKEMLYEAKPHMICTLNPEILVKASQNESYASILKTADLSLPDGIGLVWVGRLLQKTFPERVAGVDFMVNLCELAANNGNSVYFLGGKNNVAQKTQEVLCKKFPLLKSVGYSEDIINWKNNPSLQKADIIFVALGAPKQEQWMNDAIPQLPNTKIVMAVGGSFDMISGYIPRAPEWMRKYGLEWFWRFILEPTKRYKRVYTAVIVFPIKALLYEFKQ